MHGHTCLFPGDGTARDVFSRRDGPARVAEARHCLSQSHRFVGACMSYRNCEGVCRTEGFPWGRVQVARHRAQVLLQVALLE